MQDIKLTPVPGAMLRHNDDGKPIVHVMTCGTCGRSWNDAAISTWTPVPAGRCPFEYEHEVEPDDLSDTRYDEPEHKATVVCVRHPDYDNEYQTFGGPVEIIDIDMGRSDLRDAGECLDWAVSHLEDVKDADDAVQDYVTEIVMDTVAELDEDGIREHVCGTRREPYSATEVAEYLDSLPPILRTFVESAIGGDED